MEVKVSKFIDKTKATQQLQPITDTKVNEQIMELSAESIVAFAGDNYSVISVHNDNLNIDYYKLSKLATVNIEGYSSARIILSDADLAGVINVVASVISILG